MTERCLCPDYLYRGKIHQLWIDSDLNWWLIAENGREVEEGRMFDDEIEDVNDYIHDRL